MLKKIILNEKVKVETLTKIKMLDKKKSVWKSQGQKILG